MDRRAQAASGNAAPAPPGESLAPEPPATQEVDRYEELKKLGELHAAGILTDDEFAAEKAKLLDGD